MTKAEKKHPSPETEIGTWRDSELQLEIQLPVQKFRCEEALRHALFD